MTHKSEYIIYFLAVLTIGCSQSKAGEEQKGGASAFTADYVVLETDTLAREIRVTGTLLPSESAMVSAQTSGHILEIHFDEGQRVQQGQLLVSLDARQLQAQRMKIQAQLETAQKDAERKRELSTIKGVSQAVLDEAELAIANVEADKKELDVMIDYASIRAPFSGQIGLRNVSRGAYLAAGTPVARLVKVDLLKLEFSVPERYAANVRPGLPVTFTIAGSDTIFRGKVYAVEPAISESSRSLLVRAEVPNSKNLITAGQFADITLKFDKIPDAILLPTEAIIPKLNAQVVFVIQNGIVAEKQVETGIRLSRMIQVESGLSAGDTVLVTGLLQAKEGLPFKAGKLVEIEKTEAQ